MAEQKSITAKQQKVLDALNAGKTPKQIASEMKITVNGVYRHMKSLREAGHITKSKRARRTTRTARRKRTAKRNNHRSGATAEIVKAIEDAHVQAKTRMDEIDQQIMRLDAEKEELVAATGGDF